MQKFFLIVLFISFITQSYSQTDTTNLNNYFKPVKWRCIGPFRGGRSVCATGVVNDPTTYYMGTTGGGVWKTEDMGLTWNNISDGFMKTGSVGAVAVSESDPNVVYVGMGEHAVRGVMTSHGDGVYKSTDAGKTWINVGLKMTQHIARIVIDPRNPDVVLVAAQGALYGHTTERGIYKSTDGGHTWNRVLYIDDKTGCNELSMDMNNPRILYASMWEHGRLPWKVISGGPGSGLYKSTDGGETWNKMTEGLPTAMGKMAIAVSRANSNKVYAVIESESEGEKGGLYTSNDGGDHWSQVSKDHRLVQRAWYYIEVFPDTKNENTVYVMSAPALRSIDGGKTWETIGGTHGDYHNLWINPNNANNMIISNDGGSAISFNKGKSWSTEANQPTAQFYRINVDNLYPYNIYGGQQDNSSVKIASRELNSGSITKDSWSASAGGESAFLAFDPDNPRYVMGGSYLGTIEILDIVSKATTNVMAAPIQYLGRETKDMKYRFNWNAPTVWSKYRPNTFYHGAQLVLRTTDNGNTWTEFSPDVTRNEKEKQGLGGGPYTNEAVGAENYGTLAYILESPYEKGVVYTGSDDGMVYLTRDDGAHWTNVTPTGLKECLINAIEISPFDKATVYIATTRYKFNDHTPGLYKSTDYGKTWTAIDNGIASNAFTRVIREDDKRKDLLYAGTELGLYISYDGGKNWKSFQLNLPITPITDLRIHRDNLIASTMGRAFWILDDLPLIREYGNIKNDYELLTPIANHLSNMNSDLDESDNDFRGQLRSSGVNPASGIVMYYKLPELKDSQNLKMEIRDVNGRLVRTFNSAPDPNFKKYDGGPPEEPALSKKKGLNRFVWDMRNTTMNGVQDVYIESSYRGHKVPPGKYTVTLMEGSKELSKEAVVLANPLYATDAKTYAEYDAFMTPIEAEVINMHNRINDLDAKRILLEKLSGSIPGNNAQLKQSVKDLITKMKSWDNDMIQRKSKAYDDVDNFANKFTANYMFMINQTESDMPKVNQPSKDRLKELNLDWDKLRARADEIDQNVITINKALWNAGVGALPQSIIKP